VSNANRCANPGAICDHREDRHGPRGDCLVDGCGCAAYFSQEEVAELQGRLGEALSDLVPSKTVQKWADSAMFPSEKLDASEGPKVYLLSTNHDPLGSIAACAKMYKGEVVRDLAEVTDEERRYYLAELQKTKLTTPLEAVQFHFLLEGVTRSFTHQLVRQRTAAYAQESLRFAVIEDGLAERVALPPSLAGTVSLAEWAQQMTEPDGNPKSREYIERNTSALQSMRNDWDDQVGHLGRMYQDFVNQGMPAEDARGLLPHNITTRVHYVTNLRGLLDHAGNRLCTQAQFEWRLVWARMVEAIRGYIAEYDNLEEANSKRSDWQFQALAQLFKPVCYQTGKCAFEADFDRKCNIRNRVTANHDIGRTSSEWGSEHDAVVGEPIVSGLGPTSVLRDENRKPVFIGAIQPAEWLLDPNSAR
jgi:flavin-dependent thymidylate synthase